MKIKLIILAVCVVFIALLALPQQAQAKPADCSIPYVTDVNDYGKRFVATIEVAGKPHTVKAFCGKRRVHIDRIGKTVWMLPISTNTTYTIKAKAKGGKYPPIKSVLKEA